MRLFHKKKEASPEGTEEKATLLYKDKPQKKPKEHKARKGFNERAAQYQGESARNKYRYILTGIILFAAVIAIAVMTAGAISRRFDKRILKPGEVDMSEHTPVFIDSTSEEIYYESGLFAPAVVEDFTKLEAGDIIYAGPVANLVKNNCMPFDSPQSLDGEFLLSFGAWEALAEDFYKVGVSSEGDTTYISYEVIDAAIKEYFEVEELPFHIDSVTNFGEFTAVADRQAYKAASTGYEEYYVPRVTAVRSMKTTTASEDGSKELITTYVTLVLDYISSTAQEEYELENGAYPTAESSAELHIRIDPDGSYKFISLLSVGEAQ